MRRRPRFASSRHSAGIVHRVLRDVIGKRGEKIVELCLTSYKDFSLPLFSAAHLGDKWPAVDSYMGLTTDPNKRPFFLAQTKSTASAESNSNLQISSAAEDIEHLLQIPGGQRHASRQRHYRFPHIHHQITIMTNVGHYGRSDLEIRIKSAGFDKARINTRTARRGLCTTSPPPLPQR
jgi:hypothetical protein